MPTFYCPEDRGLYLDLLSAQAARYGVAILVFCLMTNHVHHVAVPETEDALSEVFKRTHQLYARKINLRQGWTGHFWQARFFSAPLGPRAAYQVIRYVLMNPVRAGLVDHPEEWPYSSARQHLGLEPVGSLVGRSDYADRLVGDWRELLSQDVGPETLDRIRRSNRAGRLLLAGK